MEVNNTEANNAEANNTAQRPMRRDAAVLLLSVFVVGLCTIVYELLIGSISSYLLGDSITQFSITIGLTMTAMGIGTLFSRKIQGNLILWFIAIEIALGLVGGFSVPILFAVYAATDLYYPAMITLIMAVGILIGLEIPLLTRVMENQFTLRDNISNVLSLDYFGAFAATLLFPFLLLPFLGIFASSIVTGAANLAVGVLSLWYFRSALGLEKGRWLLWAICLVSGLLLGALVFSQTLINAWETSVYDDRVLLSRQSRYQKIVLTRHRGDVRLFLDGSLQFSSIDEHRYHEALVHVPLSLLGQRERVLVLGGGDGLVLRELLKYKDIARIDLVDLDPVVVEISRGFPPIVKLNGGSLDDPRVTVHTMDAFKFLETSDGLYDAIIADLPDPKNLSLARLYSREFYAMARRRLSRQGILVTQATSPYFAPKAFWAIRATLEAAGFPHISPYHAYVPSFGDWGFIMASNRRIQPGNIRIAVPTRYLSTELARGLFVFSKDDIEDEVKPSSLNNPEILRYYLEGWKHWQ